jgi:hypothetical protein
MPARAVAYSSDKVFVRPNGDQSLCSHEVQEHMGQTGSLLKTVTP